MTDANAQSTREERLAASLRENLKRRKAQARAMGSADAATANSADSPETGLSKSEG